MSPRNKVIQKDGLLREMEFALTGMALSRQNGLFVSDPGTGKTSIAKHAGNQMFGAEHVLMVECSPSMVRENLVGYENPLFQVTTDAAKKGIKPWVTDGTPVDPNVFYCVLDEMTRVGQIGADELIHVTHDEYDGHRPVYAATANWLQVDQRTLPLFDRFAFVHHYKENNFDIEGILSNAAVRTWTFEVPSYEQIMQVRAWTQKFMEASGDELKAYKAFTPVARFMKEASRAMLNSGLVWNKRRVAQWKEILFACGCYYSGMVEDFEKLPAEVYEVMKHAYPSHDEKQQMKWHEIVDGLVDAVGSAIEEFKNNTFNKWRELVKAHGGVKALAKNREIITTELGQMLQDAQDELRELYGTNTEVERAIAEMKIAYRKIAQGKEI